MNRVVVSNLFGFGPSSRMGGAARPDRAPGASLRERHGEATKGVKMGNIDGRKGVT